MPKIFEVNGKNYVVLIDLDKISAATLSMVSLRIPPGIVVEDLFEREKDFVKKFGPTSNYKQIPTLH